MKTEYTKKLYHKIFDHRLAINVRYQTVSKYEQLKQPSADTVEWLLSKKYAKGTWKSMTTHSYIYNVATITVYFKDIEVFEYLKAEIGEVYFSTLEKPFSDDHVKMLKENTKLITRKTLFFNKYRLVLRVPPEQISSWQSSYKNIKAMTEWCQEQFGKDDDRYSIGGYSQGNFYFANVKDAMLFKLTWGDSSIKTELVLTVKELEEKGITA